MVAGLCNWWGSIQSDTDRKDPSAVKCLRAEDAEASAAKSSRNLTLWDPYISCAKSQPLRTTSKQIKGVQDLHNLCAYYAGREGFEPGSEESCLASPALKITSRMAKRYVHRR